MKNHSEKFTEKVRSRNYVTNNERTYSDRQENGVRKHTCGMPFSFRVLNLKSSMRQQTPSDIMSSGQRSRARKSETSENLQGKGRRRALGLSKGAGGGDDLGPFCAREGIWRNKYSLHAFKGCWGRGWGNVGWGGTTQDNPRNAWATKEWLR